MGLAEWLSSFRRLHDLAKKGKLLPADKRTYEANRDELARAMLQMQKLTLKPGESARQSLRIPRAVQVDLEFTAGSQRCATFDVSIGGFSVLLPKPQSAPGEAIGFSMRLSGEQPLIGRVTMVESKKQSANFRISFAFQNMKDEDRERVELMLFDSVLEQLKT